MPSRAFQLSGGGSCGSLGGHYLAALAPSGGFSDAALAATAPRLLTDQLVSYCTGKARADGAGHKSLLHSAFRDLRRGVERVWQVR